jgi:hypothetical protein
LSESDKKRESLSKSLSKSLLQNQLILELFWEVFGTPWILELLVDFWNKLWIFRAFLGKYSQEF